MLRRISAAFPPLLRRFLAGNPLVIPQIFRAFSSSFAHGDARDFFRRLYAAIPKEMAGPAEWKKGEREAKS